MTSQKIVHSLDWFQYSIAWPDGITSWPITPSSERALGQTFIPYLGRPNIEYPDVENGDNKSRMHGYTRSLNYGYATVHVHPRRPEQKVSVRMTGAEMATYRDMGGTEAKLVEFAVGSKSSPSRVDIAFDLFGYGIDLKRIYADWKTGKAQCRARTVRPMTSGTMGKGGEVVEATTLYFGSRESEVMVRAYDKGLEQKTDIDWTRFELEVKGDRAGAVVADMHRLGVDAVGRQMLRDYFTKMPYKFWRPLTDGVSAELTSRERKLTDRQLWIKNVVIPLLRDEIQSEWDGMVETGITDTLENLLREHWSTRALAIKMQYGLT